MATQTVVSAGGNWSATTTWVSGSVPAAGDDVVCASTSGQLTIDVNTNTIRSFVCTGYTNTITHNAGITVNIGGATAPVSNIAVVFAGTYTINNATTSAWSIADTSAATNTYNFNGATLGNVTINNGTTTTTELVTNGFNVGATATVTLTQGGFNTNGQTCSWGIFSSSNTNTRSVTLGSSSITITGVTGNAAWFMATSTGATVSAGTSTITFTGTGAGMQPGTLTYYNLVFSGQTQQLYWSGGSCTNLTITGTASFSDTFQLNSSGITATGNLTITGNSAINRLLVETNTIGTARTIIAASVSLTNVDFQDVTGAGTASPFTGTSLGDCGGNSGITMTSALSLYGVSTGTVNWSTASWSTSSGGSSGARVPLPQDTVYLDGNSGSGTYTVDMPRIGGAINFTNFTGTVSVANVISNFGSITWGSGMTLTTGGGYWQICCGRSAQTLTTNNITITTGLYFTQGLGSLAGSSITLVGNLNMPSSAIQAHGTFNANGYNVTCLSFTMFTNSPITMGSGTWTITGTGASAWVYSSGTISPNTSTIVFTDTSSSSKTFAGGGKTYNNLIVKGGGTGAVIITGANTFNNITVAGPKTLTLPASTTTTTSSFNATGTSGNVITINSSSSGTAATLSQAKGIVRCNYLSLQDNTATGGAVFYAGYNSTKVSNVTGWQLVSGAYSLGATGAG